jgi:hypothetical protein
VRTSLLAAAAGLLGATLPAACTAPWPTTCTVGYADTDLNITAQGVGADDACGKLMKVAPSSAGSSGDVTPGSGYRTSPSGTLVCRYQVRGVTITVRDQGLLRLAGRAACAALEREALVSS